MTNNIVSAASPPTFAKSREGWGTHCAVCHRKAGPPAGIHLYQSSYRVPETYGTIITADVIGIR
jgi:mono/diheme cytochrome c family protein